MTLCQKDDLTPTKEAPEDNTESTDITTDVEETKQGVENVVEYIIREVSRQWLVTSYLLKTVWHQDVIGSLSWEGMVNYLSLLLFIPFLIFFLE